MGLCPKNMSLVVWSYFLFWLEKNIADLKQIAYICIDKLRFLQQG